MSKKPRAFRLHFNRFGAKRYAKDVWTVHVTGACLAASKVDCRVPVETVYLGDEAKQPRAYLRGKGIVTCHKDGTISIR